MVNMEKVRTVEEVDEAQATIKDLGIPNEQQQAVNVFDTSKIPADSIVDFEGKDDPENPLNWSYAHRWSIIVLLSFMSTTVYVEIPYLDRGLTFIVSQDTGHRRMCSRRTANATGF
jgi:hypothetical protein